MPSPFPGMDPYLESQGWWQDFHTSSVVYCRIALTAVVPKGYVALIEADATDWKGDGPDEIRQRRIEIRRFPDRSLVTVIELLCPPNKLGSGRVEYVRRRNEWLRQPVNLVEIDLLLGGHRLPMGATLPPADYFAFISRHNRRPNCDVFAWSIRQVLPVIPIPLSASDPDVNLNLGAVFSRTFDLGPYGRWIKYAGPLELPLASEDRVWAEALGRAHAEPPPPRT